MPAESGGVWVHALPFVMAIEEWSAEASAGWPASIDYDSFPPLLCPVGTLYCDLRKDARAMGAVHTSVVTQLLGEHRLALQMQPRLHPSFVGVWISAEAGMTPRVIPKM